jgi:hypothetical protein
MQAAGAVVLAAVAALVAFGPRPEKGSSLRVEPSKGVKRHKTPVLLVHGMCCGGWVFQALAHLLATKGWEVHVITMYKNRFKTLSMYMDELRSYIETNMDEGPVLIGEVR